jgi:tetratricopeptide (TPR) repeat protein
VKNQTRSDFTVLLGDEDARVAAARRRLAGRRFGEVHTAADWPFQRDVLPAPTDVEVIWIRDLQLAFPAGQTPGTRLVLTQATYQLQRWLDWLEGASGITIVADADHTAMRQSSPEAFAGRGPWRHIAIVEVDNDAAAGGSPPDDAAAAGRGSTLRHSLHTAFAQPDPHHRLAACRQAVDSEPDNPAVQLAFASTCMELQLLEDAQFALERAAALAPDWEAVHFEHGKLLLRLEETERAVISFAEAVRLMPRFNSALLNLGAALGEMGRRGEALDVLQRAVRLDPRSHTALNNLGAVYREERLLDDAAEAFRGVIELAPTFVFGYYNLGQTLLLKGDVEAARGAYEEGFARDPQKNPRQACRLAVARAAAGDADGARQLITMLVERVARDQAVDLFAEAESTLGALSSQPAVTREAIDDLRAVIQSYSS